MRYAIIWWLTEAEVQHNSGSVYGWYESLATALKTCVNLGQQRPESHFVVVKMV